MQIKSFLLVVALAFGANAALANSDRDAPSSNAMFKPANKWLTAPQVQIDAEEQKFDLNRDGFPQYSPL